MERGTESAAIATPRGRPPTGIRCPQDFLHWRQRLGFEDVQKTEGEWLRAEAGDRRSGVRASTVLF